jgi:hypothetical protein
MSDLTGRLGPPETLGERLEEAATGETIQRAAWPAAGVEVTLRVDAEGLAVVRDFTVTAPFAEKTARGVGLGSPEADVLAAYADCLEGATSVPGQTAVAGSIYGGVIFTFGGGVVTAIFVGAGAE